MDSVDSKSPPASSPNDDMQTGWGQYELREPIGAGGMGQVFRGRHRTIGRPVAIKILNPELSRDPALVSRFMQEAEIVNAVCHPCIIDVTDFVQRDNPPRFAYVMELLSGVPLSRAVQSGPLSFAQTLNVAWQMLDALEAVHAVNVVHRDLKPDNVFVVEDLATDLSTLPSIKILDFGIAKASGATGHRTATGTILGTPAYMAPEQAAGESIGPATDVYAWAEIVYEMLVGRPVFDGDDVRIVQQKLFAQSHVETRLKALPRAATGPLAELLRRALSRYPAERPTVADAKDVVAQIGGTTSDASQRTVVAVQLKSSAETDLLAELKAGVHGGTLLDRAKTEPPEGTSASTWQADTRAGREPAVAAHGDTAPHPWPVDTHSDDEPRPHSFEEIVRGKLQADDSREGSPHTSAAIVASFAQSWQAVAYARDVHRIAAQHQSSAQVGLWTGNLYVVDHGQVAADNPVYRGAERLMTMCRPGQTLMHALTADGARGGPLPPIQWTSHGVYAIAKTPGPVEVIEASEVGARPAAPSPTGRGARRVADDARATGWRPSPGVAVPHRKHWLLERRLGEGGFGEIWLARCPEEDAPRVFKFGFGEGPRRALEREARLVARLERVLASRQDILRILGAELGSPPYFVETPYIPGGDLATWLKGRGGPDKVPLAERISIVAQIADALAASHAVGILHRDVKPSNVLIDDQSPGHPKVLLADFGIGGFATAGGGSTGDDDVTVDALADTLASGPETAANAGTALYMAPERLAGRPASMQSDVFSLGVVLYQLLVGDLHRAVASDWAASVDDPILRDDLAAMLAGESRHRIADAGDVARRLRTLEARRVEQTAAAKREAAAIRALRFRRIAVPVGIALAVLGLLMTVQTRRVTLEAQRANRAAAAAKQAAASAERVSAFLVDLFDASGRGADADLTFTPRANLTVSKPAADISARDLLERGATRIRNELTDEPLVRADLMNAISRVYLNLGRYDTALGLSQEALQLRQSMLEPQDIRVAESLNTLGMAHRMMSHYDDAERTYRKALDVLRATVGETHVRTAETFAQLAPLAYLRGAEAEARQQYERALAIRERVLGPDDVAVAESLTHLGWLDLSQRRFADADTRLRRALAIRQRALGAEHHLVAETLDLLAASQADQAKYEQAEALTREGLAIREKVLDPGHRRIANSLMTLGVIQRNRKHLEASAETLVRATSLLRAAVGTEHLDMAIASSELGLTYERLAQWENAVSAYRISLAAFTALFGQEDLSVGQLLNNLGAALCVHMKTFDEAEPMLRQALDNIKDNGAEKVWQGRVRGSLASCLRVQEKVTEAESLYRDALGHFDAADSLGPAETEERQTFAAELVALLRKQGRENEAAALEARYPLR